MSSEPLRDRGRCPLPINSNSSTDGGSGPSACSGLGTLDRLSNKDVLRAMKLVKNGDVYSLAMVTGAGTPTLPSRSYRIFTIPVFIEGRRISGKNRINGNDDCVNAYMGVGTHIDGLGHVGIEGTYYGGNTDSDVWTPTGLKKFGIQELPPIITRGVLLDIPRALETAELPCSYAITTADIDRALERQNIRIEPNDVALIHTGWLSKAETEPETFMSTEPGLSKEAAEYLASFGVVAVGADNWAVEVIPSQDAAEVFPVHQILLPKNGIYIIENVVTNTLAHDRVYEFLFALSTPRFEGAVQGPCHPFAIQ